MYSVHSDGNCKMYNIHGILNIVQSTCFISHCKLNTRLIRSISRLVRLSVAVSLPLPCNLFWRFLPLTLWADSVYKSHFPWRTSWVTITHLYKGWNWTIKKNHKGKVLKGHSSQYAIADLQISKSPIGPIGIPPGNFEMVSRQNELDLCGLFFWLNDNLT